MSICERESLKFIKDKRRIRIFRAFLIFLYCRTGMIFVENNFLLKVIFQF